MNILMPTDAFPPRCGGSGWSTYELARGLRARGHHVTIVQPRPGTPAGTTEGEYDGFRILYFGVFAPDVPYLRNYYKSERLTRLLGGFLGTLLRGASYDIVHAQHVMTTLAAIHAARDANVPSVATVRDYWPVCYWSDLLHTRSGATLCPECTAGNMRICIRPRAGTMWPLAVPLIPYMRANLAAKREGLARADAVVAVSRQIAADLLARAPELSQTRVEIIPNAVNLAALRTIANSVEDNTTSEPFALYVGKLAPNKGTRHLVDVVRGAELDWPLVVAGDGPERVELEREARVTGRRVEFRGWLDKDDTTRLMARASLLIFPSRGPESLSRVLLEASALSLPIAAMDTGGTRDIIEHDVTGLLSTTPEALAADVRRLRHDAVLRQRLGRAAALKMERQFDVPAVTGRMERLYLELSGRPRA